LKMGQWKEVLVILMPHFSKLFHIVESNSCKLLYNKQAVFLNVVDKEI
jgi:hypothetical protein